MKEIIDRNTKKVKSLDIKIKALRQELGKIRTNQQEYYNKLLQEGLDCRQDGLIWIIKIIWSLGFNVDKTRLPVFLDETAINYLFKMAKLSNEYDKIKKEFRSIIKMRQGDRIKRVTLRKSDTWKGVVSGIVKKFLKGRASSKSIVGILPRISKKLLSSEIIYRKRVDNNKIKYNDPEASDGNLVLKEQRMDEVRKEMVELKKTEITRIMKEFFAHDYGRKYSISLERVMSALVGERNAQLEIRAGINEYAAKSSVFENTNFFTQKSY